MNSKANNTQTRRLTIAGGALAAFLSTAHLATDALTSTFTALLPTIQEQFSLSETALASLVALLSFSSLVAQPVFGSLSDRLDARLVSSIGVILCTSLLSLIAVAPTVITLAALLIVGGFGSAAFHPAASALAREAGGRHAGLTVSLFSAGGTLGLALGPILILSVVATRGLSFAPWLMVPGVIVGVLLYLVVPSKKVQTEGPHTPLIDTRLLISPVGLLCLTGVFSSIAVIAFSSAIPLWLVADKGVVRDDPLIGWTLATFSLSAAFGGIVAGVLSTRFSRRLLITGSMLLALAPLLGVFALEPGSPAFFLVVALAGMLTNAGLPLMLVTAQDLAPHAVAAASGMLMGLTSGTAGLLYIGVGRLQGIIGLAPAMMLSYLALVPGAILAFVVLTRFVGANDMKASVERAVVSISAGVCGHVYIASGAGKVATASNNKSGRRISVLDVPEIGCDPCRQTITATLELLVGVESVVIDVPSKEVVIEYDPHWVTLDRIKDVLEGEHQPPSAA